MFGKWNMKMRLTLLFSLLLLISGGVFLCLKSSKPPYLTVVGRVKMADGIGRQSVEVIDALRMDIPISFVPTVPPELQDVPKPVREIITKKSKRYGKVVLFEDVLWMPNHPFYKKMPKNLLDDTIRIAYSMFESDVIPHEWVVILNTRFDAVVVPDRYFLEVYRKSGVQIPIFEIPLGLNISEFLRRPLKKQRNFPMVFANLSGSDDRKNQLLLIRAFAKVFSGNPNVILKLNSRFQNEKEGSEIRREISKLNLKNVHFTEFSLKKKDYLKFFEGVDCYVNLSKGEGFSIQPREAMALGIPVIVSDNTAQTTLCQSGLVKTVSSTIEEPAFYRAYNNQYGSFFNCDLDEAAQAMLDVYSNYKMYLQNAEQSREWVKKYEFTNLRDLYKSLIKPKEVILGSHNEITPEYMITNSQDLYDKYSKLIEDDK